MNRYTELYHDTTSDLCLGRFSVIRISFDIPDMMIPRDDTDDRNVTVAKITRLALMSGLENIQIRESNASCSEGPIGPDPYNSLSGLMTWSRTVVFTRRKRRL